MFPVILGLFWLPREFHIQHLPCQLMKLRTYNFPKREGFWGFCKRSFIWDRERTIDAWIFDCYCLLEMGINWHSKEVLRVLFGRAPLFETFNSFESYNMAQFSLFEIHVLNSYKLAEMWVGIPFTEVQASHILQCLHLFFGDGEHYHIPLQHDEGS